MMRAAILIALCFGAAAAVATAAPVTVTVTVGDTQIPMTLQDNEDPVQAATAFVEKHNLGADLVGPIVQELDRQTAAAAAAAPVLTLPLSVGGVERNLQYFAGQVPEEAARAFLIENGVPAGDDLERSVALVAGEVRKALELGGQQQAAAQAAAAAAQATERPIVVTVEVNMGEAGLVPLHVRDGDTPDGAAAAFARAHGLGDDTVATLSGAIQRKLREEQAAAAATAAADAEAREAAQRAAALFTLDIDIDGATRTLLYHAGREPADVAAEFARATGVTNAEGVAAIEGAIRRRLAEVQADAAAAASTQTVSFMLAGRAFDLEYQREGADIPTMSRGFCNAEWDAVQAALAEAGTAGITIDTCVSTVAQLLQTKVV